MSVDLNDEHIKVLPMVENESCKDGKQDAVKQENSIKCVNFEMDDSTIRFKRLMNNLVYSPNARFAVNISTTEKKVTSMLVLDPFNMKFHQYQNCSERNLDMEVFYWYSEDCLIFIHVDEVSSTLHQTPIVLNHQTKTYEARAAVTYSVPSTISFKHTSREAHSLELEGRRYVLLISINPFYRDIYAISHKPDSSIRLKRFALLNYVNFVRTEFIDKIEAQLVDRIVHFLISTQVAVLNNHILFPLRFDCKQNLNDVRRRDVSEILGMLVKVKFTAMPELPADAKDNEIYDYFMSVYYVDQLIVISECVELNGTLAKKEEHVKRPGVYKNVKDNLVFVSEEKKADENVSTVSYIDVSKRKTSTIHTEVYSNDSEVCVCSTPFNILIAKKISPTRISCSTIQYPFNKRKVSTLQEMILSKTYLNMDGKQEFAHTFTI